MRSKYEITWTIALLWSRDLYHLLLRQRVRGKCWLHGHSDWLAAWHDHQLLRFVVRHFLRLELSLLVVQVLLLLQLCLHLLTSNLVSPQRCQLEALRHCQISIVLCWLECNLVEVGHLSRLDSLKAIRFKGRGRLPFPHIRRQIELYMHERMNCYEGSLLTFELERSGRALRRRWVREARHWL